MYKNTQKVRVKILWLHNKCRLWQFSQNDRGTNSLE